MAKTVKVYDFNTKQVSEIPEAELASGMILARVEGVGTVWVEAARLKAGELRHGPFPPAIREYIVGIQERLKEVRPLTLEEWEDGFRRDAHPEDEIARWAHAARVYEHCVEEFNFDAAQRQELFKRVLVGCLVAPPESVLTLAKLETVTKEQAQRAINLFFHWNKHIGDENKMPEREVKRAPWWKFW